MITKKALSQYAAKALFVCAILGNADEGKEEIDDAGKDHDHNRRELFCA